ncbi:uncharacterized protein LOC111342257 [Stylophora pistillata]|uniref:uncharacterized protein LOC111342257 n=1 Tax=Stylophora pistillata TaxID=50429 RepID=UPI000C04D836|nr:uncharacterized protein LOC111342257 [Stylophora pistillata]
MESGVISDAQITASSRMNNNSTPRQARLNFIEQGSKQGGWSSLVKDRNQWLQVDLGSYTTVTGVATQGRNSTKLQQWITTFTLQFSFDGVIFQLYKEPGKMSAKLLHANQDSNTVVYNKLISPITARYIRLWPATWHNHISLRMELYGCRGCCSPLGMESQVITDAQITASTQWNNNSPAKSARLKLGGWVAGAVDPKQWLQVDLGTYSTVTAVATQGVNLQGWQKSWTASYHLQYSDDGVTFHFYKEPGETLPKVLGGNRAFWSVVSNKLSQPITARYIRFKPLLWNYRIGMRTEIYGCLGNPKIFTGNGDSESAVYNILNPPITARYIRILPIAWHTKIAMRIEIYGCTVCSTPLGMESGAIKDAQITASTQWDDNHAPSRARLNLKLTGVKRGAWSTRVLDLKQWLHVDLLSLTIVTGVATQGRNAPRIQQWVTKYRFQYSNDGVNFHFYKEKGDNSFKIFTGNGDSESAVYNILNPPITARYIRILPIAWHTNIAMRIEIYGCTVCSTPLGMESGAIKDAQITASTQWDDNHATSRARLNLKLTGVKRGAWSTRVVDPRQWLQVDLLSLTIVTGVATQGRNAPRIQQWVTKYRFQYSNDGVNFHFYKEKGDNSFKVFSSFLLFLMFVNRVCFAPLGMEDGTITDVQVSSSSRLDDNHSPSQARLNFKDEGFKAGGWSAQTNDKNQWLQVDLGIYTRVTRVATQGLNANDEWVTKYRIQYSDDGGNFQYYKQQGDNKWTVLTGNKGSDTIAHNDLNPPITARFIRFLPNGWHNKISMRTEIYGCPACVTALGMESQAIEDAQISASSQLDGNYSAIQGRLHLKRNGQRQGGWSALTNDRNQWLQVDLNTFARVTVVATQGRDGFKEWVTKYSLQYSDDGVTFTFYKEFDSSSVTRVATQGLNANDEWVTKYRLQYSDDGRNFQYYKQQGDNKWTVLNGNKGSDTNAYNNLNPPLTARFIRFLPNGWHNRISMRTEIYGCPVWVVSTSDTDLLTTNAACVTALGMESQTIEDAQIRASSQVDGNYSAIQGRLHLKRNGQKQGGWSALTNDLNQWLQVDLNTFARVTVVATQGRDGFKEWVTKYNLQYSDDGVTFAFYKEFDSSSEKVWCLMETEIRVGRNGHDEWVTKFRLQYGEDEDILHFFEDPGHFAAKVFKGNTDSDTVVYDTLTPPIITRYIRFKPAEWHNRISMRVEIYGCSGCINPLGMAFGSISDIHITASSQLDGNHSASQARLHFQADGYKVGGWSALTNDVNPWLQVDLGSYTKVTRLATQGMDGYNQWVFDGNQDQKTVVYNVLSPPITTRYIQLKPIAWNDHISMRMEIYGCPGCVAPLGMDSGAITDAQISASSQWDDNHAARQGRLHFKRVFGTSGSWSSRRNDLNQWFQVDLAQYTTVTGIATQGRNHPWIDQYVTAYKLQYSDDGVSFQFYKETPLEAEKVYLYRSLIVWGEG